MVGPWVTRWIHGSHLATVFQQHWCKPQHLHSSYCLLRVCLLLSKLRIWPMFIAEPSTITRHKGRPSKKLAFDCAVTDMLGLACVPFPGHITSYSRHSIQSATTCSKISLLVLLSGDIYLNPGSTAHDIYPRGHCEHPPNWSDQAVLCDSCEVWFHRSYHNMSITEYAIHTQIYPGSATIIIILSLTRITLMNSTTVVWTSRVEQGPSYLQEFTLPPRYHLQGQHFPRSLKDGWLKTILVSIFSGQPTL